ncbi:hypothetical protein [Amycolatopsis sp. SID8362]|nr:hypothetical protein [Amycolatopsis sp. SID8362]NBH09348.1 hypothetical protein [Amycolatopsis sp. SID8362]NED46041.1 hypothetical protein [Amycolatopsis sp. SID8362]
MPEGSHAEAARLPATDLLIAMFGVVSIVARCQARPEDVPKIFTEAT